MPPTRAPEHSPTLARSRRPCAQARSRAPQPPPAPLTRPGRTRTSRTQDAAGHPSDTPVQDFPDDSHPTYFGAPEPPTPRHSASTSEHPPPDAPVPGNFRHPPLVPRGLPVTHPEHVSRPGAYSGTPHHSPRPHLSGHTHPEYSVPRPGAHSGTPRHSPRTHLPVTPDPDTLSLVLEHTLALPDTHPGHTFRSHQSRMFCPVWNTLRHSPTHPRHTFRSHPPRTLCPPPRGTLCHSPTHPGHTFPVTPVPDALSPAPAHRPETPSLASAVTQRQKLPGARFPPFTPDTPDLFVIPYSRIRTPATHTLPVLPLRSRPLPLTPNAPTPVLRSQRKSGVLGVSRRLLISLLLPLPPTPKSPRTAPHLSNPLPVSTGYQRELLSAPHLGDSRTPNYPLTTRPVPLHPGTRHPD